MMVDGKGRGGGCEDAGVWVVVVGGGRALCVCCDDDVVVCGMDGWMGVWVFLSSVFLGKL